MLRLLFPCLLLAFTTPVVAEGIRPVGRDGQALNLDFEDGTLKDWIAEGRAFTQQPVKGDTVLPRRGYKSGHQGDYWIGGYEIHGDDPQGTLTSVAFEVTHPFASFLVGGGAWPETRVELVRADTRAVIFKSSGNDHEGLRPVVADLKAHAGKEIFIRIVDQRGGHWGHINFDDFRFHSARPKFANELDPAKVAADVPEADQVQHDGLSPEEAAKAITLPPGFKAHLFAGEPDVRQPIAFAMDDRGRLWVAECYTYPRRAPEGEGKDRILIFEDTDGDHQFNTRTVFAEGLNLVTGLEVGFGGVWVGAAPYLLFIPDRDGDGKPDGPPEVVLDGWGYQDTHETLNTFTWGPDGWLYGCHGVFTHSKVGKPGTPDDQRVKLNAGVWRYHPTKHIFEVFAEGTSNPWGIDFDEHGQCVVEACVIPHLFHIIQGARYHRQSGSHFNPHIYEDIKTHADHVHWAGTKGPHAGNNRSDAAGGGHAHAGLMIYQGESWPAEYRGKIFMHNVHGRRVNMDIPERNGSGFVGKHGPDFLLFNDKWSQALHFQTDQNGSVYIIDWYDRQQCHNNNPDDHDRSNGRIYKIVYNDEKWTPADGQKFGGHSVLTAVYGNEWESRRARRLLLEQYDREEKKLAPMLPEDPAERRRQIAHIQKGSFASIHRVYHTVLSDPNATARQQLRAVWALHATGGLDSEIVPKLLGHKDEYVRAWTIQLVCEEKPDLADLPQEFVRMAREDKSPVVRLYLASALQRVPPQDRWEILEGLLTHAADSKDHNLPLMYWYAAEPMATVDVNRALSMAVRSEIVKILNFTTRRVAALDTPAARAAIVAALKPLIGKDDPRELAMLQGFQSALTGRRTVAMPRGWEQIEEAYTQARNPDLRATAESLSLTFGSTRALASLRRTVANGSLGAGVRRNALESLIGARDPELPSLLQALLKDTALRGQALRALGAFDDPKTPARILEVYPSLSTAERRDALNTLASRVSFARPMLAAAGSGVVPRQDLTAELIRQLRNLKSDELNAEIETVWGAVRERTADKQKEIERYRGIYRAGGSLPGDASRGRELYARLCQQCHVLFDTGGEVGPDLTGSNRADLDYILENMIDPNAVIPNEYRTTIIETKDDRIITGIVKKQDGNAVTILTANESLVIPRNEIELVQHSEISMMPEELLEALSAQEVRDLIYYLRQPGQVPLPEGSNQ